MYTGSLYIFRVVVGDRSANLLKAKDESFFESRINLRLLTKQPLAVRDE